MGLISKIFKKPSTETGNEQYQRVSGAKSVADMAYENVSDAKKTSKSATQAGSTISRWGKKISAGAGTIPGAIQNPKFQEFAKNAVANSNNLFGTTGFGGNRDLVGFGGSAPNKKKKTKANGMRPAFYDPKTGKTYLAKNSKKKSKPKHERGDSGEFNPW